jgi:transcriptional regulator with XRE-family HTH domain
MKTPTPIPELDKSQREDCSESAPDVHTARLKSLRKADHVRFANRLEAFRKERGWTVSKLARYLGMQRVTLCRWIHLRQGSRAFTRRRLSRRLSFLEPNYEPIEKALRRYSRLNLSIFDRCTMICIELGRWLHDLGFPVITCQDCTYLHVVIRVRPNKAQVFWIHITDDHDRCCVVLSRHRLDRTKPEEEVAGVLTIGVIGEFLDLLLSIREPHNIKSWPEPLLDKFGNPRVPEPPDYRAIEQRTLKRCGVIGAFDVTRLDPSRSTPE